MPAIDRPLSESRGDVAGGSLFGIEFMHGHAQFSDKLYNGIMGLCHPHQLEGSTAIPAGENEFHHFQKQNCTLRFVIFNTEQIIFNTEFIVSNTKLRLGGNCTCSGECSYTFRPIITRKMG